MPLREAFLDLWDKIACNPDPPRAAVSTFLNISAYKFAPLDGLPALRERLLHACQTREIKGTILLSAEGINLFVAGVRPTVDALIAEIRSVSGLEDLAVKESESAEQPFGRMMVKIKKEIIAFGIEGIDPARRPTAKLSPSTLKQWLDEGRPMTLLDTRNDYEVRLGTFHGAVSAGIRRFREFPASVKQLPSELKERPLVMFCTGGIRCEKAGPFMEQAGFKNVHQLDGGILKYFHECGSAHFNGECFVFDQRVGVDAQLRETNAVLCRNCSAPLSEAEQQHPRFSAGKSCPRCHTAACHP